MKIETIRSAAQVSSYLETRWDIPLNLARQMTESVIDGFSFELVSVRGEVAHIQVNNEGPDLTIAGRTIPRADLVKKTKTSGRRASELFWQLWRDNKSEIKSAGLGCMKDRGGWDVTGPLGRALDGVKEPRPVADQIEAKIEEAKISEAFQAKLSLAKASGRSNPKSEKLVALYAEMEFIGEDYQNPRRSQVIGEFFAEMDACGRVYFDDRLDAWGINNGRLYGEETMLSMISDGTLALDAKGNLDDGSVQEHCGGILERAGY